MLQVENLTVRFCSSSVPVLNRVSFSVSAGEAIGLVGKSGAGKTTLARALLGFLPARSEVLSGSIRFGGIDILRADEHRLQKIRGLAVSYVSQHPELALNPFIRVGEQVSEVIRAHRKQKARDCREQAHELLEQLALTDLYSAYPHQLSGGQRQRVVIAQAVACRPALLVADEPTSALDIGNEAEVLGLLESLRRDYELSLILITHSPDILAGIIGRVLLLSGGEIHEHRVAQKPGEKSGNPLFESKSTSFVSSRENRPALEDPPLVETRNLHKSYIQGGRWKLAGRTQKIALANVNLKIARRTTLALIGPSGAGKSTLGRCLARLEDPDSGEILFRGQQILDVPRRQLISARRRIQLIFQHSATALNPFLSALEIVTEPLRVHPGASKREMRDHALSSMEQVGLPLEWADRRSTEFSGGQRQRLAIARALILEPDLLILDEALSGLDILSQMQIVELLQNLQSSRPISYLVICHKLSVVAGLLDAIAVMRGGTITEASRPDDFWAAYPEVSREAFRALSPIET